MNQFTVFFQTPKKLKINPLIVTESFLILNFIFEILICVFYEFQ